MNDCVRRPLGRTNLELTGLGFGGAPLGNLWTAVSDAEAQEALQAAWGSGIRYFDTAPWYGIGLSEHRVGTFLRGVPREEYVLSTKVGRLLRPWPRRYGHPKHAHKGIWRDALEFEVRFDYSYGGIMRSFEDSLQRLGVAEVDMLLIHDLDRFYHSPEGQYQARLDQLANGGIDALRDLRAEGKVSAIGAGINCAGVIPDLLGLADLDVFLVAGPYTLMDQQILATELQQCQDAGVGIVIGAAFGSGLLINGVGDAERLKAMQVDAETVDRLRRLDAVCKSVGVPLPCAAVQFPAAHPAVVSLVFGATNRAQVEQTVGWFRASIPDRLWDQLKAEGLLADGAPVPGGADSR